MDDERIIKFGNLKPLPEGWRVVQLDSGHYIGTNDYVDTPITVNRFHARKWAIALALAEGKEKS